MKKIYGYIGHADNIANKREFNRQYHGIREWAANNEKGRVQFVAEMDPERVSPQKVELANLLSSRLQSGDTLLTELPTLGSSMLDIVDVLSLLVQKGVTVYWLQGSELVWIVEPKVMAFIELVVADILEDVESASKEDRKGNGGKAESRMLVV